MVSVRIPNSMTDHYFGNASTATSKNGNIELFDKVALLWTLIRNPYSFIHQLARMKRDRTEYNRLQLAYMETILERDKNIEHVLNCPFCAGKKKTPEKATYFAITAGDKLGRNLISCEDCFEELLLKSGNGAKLYQIRFSIFIETDERGNLIFSSSQMREIAGQIINYCYGIKGAQRKFLYKGDEILKLFFPEKNI